jgi:thioester reductase-like protein
MAESLPPDQPGTTRPVYCVTGYPGFTSRRVLERVLMREPEARVRVVVPAHKRERAEQALDQLSVDQRVRVRMLEGETPYLDLGLSGVEYRELAAELTYVQHVEQALDIGTSSSVAEAVHVGGMREVLELGRVAPNLRSMVIHSSALVSGDRSGLVLETELSAGQSFATPAVETLARAERMARAAMLELPVVVVRSPHVVGDSATGETGELDGLYVLLLAMLSSPQAFLGAEESWLELSLDMVPVDHVVSAVHHLGTAREAVRSTYQLSSPRPASVRRVAELLHASRERLFPGASIGSDTVRAFLSSPATRLWVRGPKALALTFGTRARYDTHQADRSLRPAGILCPAFETYVDAIVTHLLTRAFGRPPELGR